ncbi:hypothetical protein [Haloferax sp. Atlit-12N]|uniref:hypothetical protein n=1 Tax=Haloferax sp. Atlit-12N TaxID=2077203 RepID=UPI001F3213E5|nr:hypothetical protein [Haloferax sp. Atlit-12N]
MTEHVRSYRQRCEDCGRVVSIAPYCSSCGASLRDDELTKQATDEASSVLFDRWLCKAAENIEEWGVQDEATLLLAIQEELGELTQAHLEAKHEDGRDSRVDEELDDLGALLLQLHESRQRGEPEREIKQAYRLACLLTDAENLMSGEADELACRRPHPDEHLYHVEEGLRFHANSIRESHEEVISDV